MTFALDWEMTKTSNRSIFFDFWSKYWSHRNSLLVHFELENSGDRIRKYWFNILLNLSFSVISEFSSWNWAIYELEHNQYFHRKSKKWTVWCFSHLKIESQCHHVLLLIFWAVSRYPSYSRNCKQGSSIELLRSKTDDLYITIRAPS